MTTITTASFCLIIVFFQLGCAQVRSELGYLGLVSAPSVELGETSSDPEYGYTEEKPVRVGGMKETSSHRNQYLYLQQLAGPEGEELAFRRLGSCCPYESPAGMFGHAMLDMWEIRTEGRGEPIIIYLDSYSYEQPKIPMGLSRKQD